MPRQRHARFTSADVPLDVLLDPILSAAATRCARAMICGTPIVAWPGRFMRGRALAGAYHQMRLADAESPPGLGDSAASFGLEQQTNPASGAARARAKAGELFADRKAVQQFESFLEAAVRAADMRRALPPEMATRFPFAVIRPVREGT
ncbi:MAG: hypothetical protein U1E60_08945 [Reyranellaceae bacterium]